MIPWKLTMSSQTTKQGYLKLKMTVLTSCRGSKQQALPKEEAAKSHVVIMHRQRNQHTCTVHGCSICKQDKGATCDLDCACACSRQGEWRSASPTFIRSLLLQCHIQLSQDMLASCNVVLVECNAHTRPPALYSFACILLGKMVDAAS